MGLADDSPPFANMVSNPTFFVPVLLALASVVVPTAIAVVATRATRSSGGSQKNTEGRDAAEPEDGGQAQEQQSSLQAKGGATFTLLFSVLYLAVAFSSLTTWLGDSGAAV